MVDSNKQVYTRACPCVCFVTFQSTRRQPGGVDDQLDRENFVFPVSVRLVSGVPPSNFFLNEIRRIAWFPPPLALLFPARILPALHQIVKISSSFPPSLMKAVPTSISTEIFCQFHVKPDGR